MRRLLILATLALLPNVALAQQRPVQTDVSVTCYPSAQLDSHMTQQGFTTRLIGAFDDGDLLVVYQNGTGAFHAGFAIPKEGYTCMLGPGTGLQKVETPDPGEAS